MVKEELGAAKTCVTSITAQNTTVATTLLGIIDLYQCSKRDRLNTPKN